MLGDLPILVLIQWATWHWCIILWDTSYTSTPDREKGTQLISKGLVVEGHRREGILSNVVEVKHEYPPLTQISPICYGMNTRSPICEKQKNEDGRQMEKYFKRDFERTRREGGKE